MIYRHLTLSFICTILSLPLYGNQWTPSKGKLKIFILAGQSNMVGHGFIKGPVGTMESYVEKAPEKYGHLVDEEGSPKARNDVWFVDISKDKIKSEYLNVGFGAKPTMVGPEYGFGHVIGDAFKDPVLIIRCAWGGKSLAEDFLPPSIGKYQTPTQSGDPGYYYSRIVNIVNEVTKNLDVYCPIYKRKDYDIVGFGWHQGWNDRIDQKKVDKYEKNLVALIKDLRKDLNIKNLPFVIANTGMGGWIHHPRSEKKVNKHLAAQQAVTDSNKYPEFKDNVDVVETRDFWRPIEESPNKQGYHWNGNWETHYLIGQSMAESMISLLQEDSKLSTETSIKPTNEDNITIDSVFFAQTHVSQLNNPYFNLTANRATLIKAHISATEPQPAPKVFAQIYTKDNQIKTIDLTGPNLLPTESSTELGKVQHSLKDSFTAIIPAEFIKPGTSVEVFSGTSQQKYELKVGAPNPLKMIMYDVHYFGKEKSDYSDTFFSELKEKLPISDLEVQRIRDIKFHEMVIPARNRGKYPAVRVKSEEEYKEKTGTRFDGEQAAALQWIAALRDASGTSDLALNYINITGVPSGGQAGGFKGVGQRGAEGIAFHELGHALSLPHWGRVRKYPYRGDMYGIEALPKPRVHVGPIWAFDLPSMTFISPILHENYITNHNNNPRAKFKLNQGTQYYKTDPMQGGGSGKQEEPFLLNHFSDYSVYQMQKYLEKKIARNINGEYYKWDPTTNDYTNKVSNSDNIGILYPLKENVDVYSVITSCILSDDDISMIYPPIGPYKSNLMHRFHSNKEEDRQTAIKKAFVPDEGCDFSLKVIQGGKKSIYMLQASGKPGSNPSDGSALKTVAINLPASDGRISQMELLYTPDVELNGMLENPEVLYTWK